RAIAAALLRRLREPELAKRLDSWVPSIGAQGYGNPSPIIAKEMKEAFQGEADLAYERATRGAVLDENSSSAMWEVVATGPDAANRLTAQVATVSCIPRLLVKLLGDEAAPSLAKALVEVTDSHQRRILIREVGDSKTRNENVLAVVRREAESSTDMGTRVEA